MIYNLGSINIDHFYRVPHLLAPGETLAATGYSVGLGGKGANQSAAIAKAGARVAHIGAVGSEGAWARDRLAGWGVDVAHLIQMDLASGHAIINVDEAGENNIVLFPGTNRAMPFSLVEGALAGASAGDILILQNETAHQAAAAALGRRRGMQVIYSAAPFSVEAVRAVLKDVTVLVLNALEAEQLGKAMGLAIEEIDVPEILVTRGARGALWLSRAGGRVSVPALKVAAVDTTGAGDTFLGYFAAARDQGLATQAALEWAGAAAALKVTRPGTADAIPTAAEVAAFLAARGIASPA